jgi:AraC family transcriptional regulator, regulatory protein of adaptative response / methylated-DNA-[protein]-cysteine methyltransferase
MRHEALGPELVAAVALAGNPWTEFARSLAIGGTPFQKRVGAALRKIPTGATETYAEVARRLCAP